MASSLTAKDRADISDAVAEGVKQGIETASTSGCACNLSDDARKEMGHYFGMVKDVGGGDYSAGVEVLRENHKLLAKFRATSQKVGGVIVMSICAAVIGGIGWGIKVVWSVMLGSGGK